MSAQRGKPSLAQAELVKTIRNQHLALEGVVEFDSGVSNAQDGKQGQECHCPHAEGHP